MDSLKKIFRVYSKEQHRELSEHQKRMLAVDEKYAFTLQQRDLAAEERKDKRAVNVVKRVFNPKIGKHETVRYTAGVFATRDHGSPQEKLRKAFGGKAARRLLNEERRLGKANPEQLVVHVEDESGEKHALVRGVDFVLLPPAFGGPKLLLHDMAQEFTVSYSDDLIPQLG